MAKKATNEEHSRALEEEIFGTGWRAKCCTTHQAIEYFTRRFGLGRTAFYASLYPLVTRVRLVPKGDNVKGSLFLVEDIVRGADALFERVKAQAA